MSERLKERLFEIVISFILLICIAGLGWTGKTIIQHETRISVIESNRYSDDDALKDQRRVDDKLAAILQTQIELKVMNAKIDHIQKDVTEIKTDNKELRKALNEHLQNHYKLN